MRTSLRVTTDADIDYVAEHLRDIDRRECEELFGQEPLSVLRESEAGSDWCFTALAGRTIIAVIGVAPVFDGGPVTLCGMPWMVGTKSLARHPRAFVEMTGPLIQQMARQYPLLENVVHNESRQNIAWLRRSGFTIGNPEPIGRAGALFRRFRMERSCSLLH